MSLVSCRCFFSLRFFPLPAALPFLRRFAVRCLASFAAVRGLAPFGIFCYPRLASFCGLLAELSTSAVSRLREPPGAEKGCCGGLSEALQLLPSAFPSSVPPFRKSPGAEKGCCSRVSGCVAAASLRCLFPSWLPGCLRPVGKVLPERKKGSCAATTTLRRSVAFVPLERSARRKGALLPFRDVFLFAVSFSGGTVCEPPRAERTVAASGVRKCFHCSPSPPPLLLRPSGEPSRAEKGCCDGVAVRLRALSVVGSVPCCSRPRRAVGAVCSNLDPSPCRARKRGRCGGRGSEALQLLPFAASPPSSPSWRTSLGGKGALRQGSYAVAGPVCSQLRHTVCCLSSCMG